MVDHNSQHTVPTGQQLLLQRLDDIGRSVARSEHALALIGLGSVGQELDRLDRFSDLDFFVIVDPDHKQDFIDDLGWLSSVCPIAFSFQNTADGHKVLYSDGVFCEFAVFAPEELERIAFSPGRMVWKRPGVPAALVRPTKPARPLTPRTTEWLLGESITNLYMGLARDHRGERLSAMRFIQGHAVDRVLELAERLGPRSDITPDAFALERRFERRFPQHLSQLSEWLQGYDRNRQSAAAILTFLERHFDVNPAMAKAIRSLCDSPAARGHR